MLRHDKGVLLQHRSTDFSLPYRKDYCVHSIPLFSSGLVVLWQSASCFLLFASRKRILHFVHAVLFDLEIVSLYVGELCITLEYFSRIMKSFSGKTVNQWISEALMREAEISLRNPDLTIQQVADMLNFSDQSSFGKFF